MSKDKENSSKKTGKASKNPSKSKSFFTDERIIFLIGILITGFAFLLLLACISYLFYWKPDSSLPHSDVVSGPEIVVKNWEEKEVIFFQN